jgi:transposase
MLRIAMYITIKTLYEKGHNKSQIAKMTGHTRKTVRKIIKAIKEGKEAPDKKPHPKILDNHKDQIIKWISEDFTSLRMHEELIRMGVKISYSAVKYFVSSIQKNKNIFMRIHTKPAEEAQVDFGYVGYTLDNLDKRRKTWVFNMRLSYSRLDYYEKVYNQKVETFINCHINAFNYFKGVPETIKIDNLKAAILQANFYEPIFQEQYKNFANHYGFKPLPCRVYTPNDKGKVESGIKYIKNNFFLGRKFKNEDDLNYQLNKWLDKANSRIHGTTKKVPLKFFESEEKDKLLPPPVDDFKLAKVGTRKVYHDCHIYVEHNYYSVPFEYIGKEVEIEISRSTLKVFYNLKAIAIHPICLNKGKFITNNNHYPKYKRISETEYQEKYQAKMKNLGPFSEQLFFWILQNQKGSWYRTVQGILSLEKSYTKEILELACKRALAFRVYEYQTIKNICKNGSYKLPVEFEVTYEYYQN